MTDDDIAKITDSTEMNSVEANGPKQDQPTGLGAKLEFSSAEASTKDMERYKAQAKRTAEERNRLFGMNDEEDTQEAKPMMPEPPAPPEMPVEQPLGPIARRLAEKQKAQTG